jgi:hypothetical protein
MLDLINWLKSALVSSNVAILSGRKPLSPTDLPSLAVIANGRAPHLPHMLFVSKQQKFNRDSNCCLNLTSSILHIGIVNPKRYFKVL